MGSLDGKEGAPSFELATIFLAGGKVAVVLAAVSFDSSLIPLAVVGLKVEALVSTGLVASVVVVTPNCFLSADA